MVLSAVRKQAITSFYLCYKMIIPYFCNQKPTFFNFIKSDGDILPVD